MPVDKFTPSANAVVAMTKIAAAITRRHFIRYLLIGWNSGLNTRSIGLSAILRNTLTGTGAAVQSAFHTCAQPASLRPLRLQRLLAGGYERSYRAVDLCAASKLYFPSPRLRCNLFHLS